MGGGERYKRRRRNMWLRNKCCRRCGVETTLPEDLSVIYKLPLNKLTGHLDIVDLHTMATIDHDKNKLHPNRGRQGQYTLLCWLCNQLRGQEDVKRFMYEHRKRSFNPYHCKNGHDFTVDPRRDVEELGEAGA